MVRWTPLHRDPAGFGPALSSSLSAYVCVRACRAHVRAWAVSTLCLRASVSGLRLPVTPSRGHGESPALPSITTDPRGPPGKVAGSTLLFGGVAALLVCPPCVTAVTLASGMRRPASCPKSQPSLMPIPCPYPKASGPSDPCWFGRVEARPRALGMGPCLMTLSRMLSCPLSRDRTGRV